MAATATHAAIERTRMSLKSCFVLFILTAWALGVNADPLAGGGAHDKEVERYASIEIDIRGRRVRSPPQTGRAPSRGDRVGRPKRSRGDQLARPQRTAGLRIAAPRRLHRVPSAGHRVRGPHQRRRASCRAHHFHGGLLRQRDRPARLAAYAPVRGEHLRKIMDTRTRRLEKVPGLKGLLLAHARAGMSPASCRERAERRSPEWPSWMLSIAALALYSGAKRKCAI